MSDHYKQNRSGRRLLAIALSILMTLSAVPVISLSTAPQAKAYGTYSKNYSTEYYYASGTTFVKAVCAGYDSSSTNTVRSQMSGAGWTPTPTNLDMMQDWSGTKHIAVGYKTTTDPTQALTGIKFFDSDDAHSNYSWDGKNSGWNGNHGGTDSSGYKYVQDAANTNIHYYRGGEAPFDAYSVDGVVDFLMKMGSGYGCVYLCQTRDRAAGAPITAMDSMSSTSANGYTAVGCVEGGCTYHSAAHSHSSRYVGIKRLTTTVSSDTLRSNYTTALGRYNESNYSAKYTSASRTALQNALTTAEGILSDLSDGYTTSNQTAINNAASAVSGLTLNTYTVTFKGYTSGTTTGTLKTQTVSYGGNATAPSVSTTYDGTNHYTFKSWSGTYTNVTSARTITATYNTVAHSFSYSYSWAANGSSCSGTRTCSGCAYSQTVNGAVTSAVQTAATCAAKGTTKYTATFTSPFTTQTKSIQDIPVNSSNHSGGTEIRNAVSATCGAAGYTGDTYCKGCGAKLSSGSSIAATGNHTWNSGEITTPPQCMVKGVRTFTCTVCGATRTEEVAPNGHTYGTPSYTWSANGASCTAARVCSACSGRQTENGTVTSAVKTPATCRTMGTTTYTATFSNAAFTTQTKDIQDIALDASNHDGDTEIRGAKAPTCAEEGYTGDTWCLGCNTKIADGTAIAKTTDHNWNDGVVTTAPGCIDEGVKTFTCTVCGTTRTEAVPANGHTPADPVTENTVAPTCAAEGSYDEVVYCEACGTELSRETKTTDKIAHTPADAVTENFSDSTCAAEGSYDEVVYCAKCGAELSREEKTVEKKAHTPADAVTENFTDSTCAAEGSYDEVVYCAKCGAELSREEKTVEKKAHTPADAVTENFTDSTCAAEGSYDEVVYCSECGAELNRETKTVEKKAHTPAEPVRENIVASYCNAEGSYDEVVYCAKCGAELSRENKTVAMIGHTPGDVVIENENAATCTAAGSYDKVTYCTFCGTETSRETVTVEKLPHTPGDAVTENEIAATCSAAGSYDKVTYCVSCGTETSRETVTVEKLPHTPGDAVTENEVAPSCTAAGSYDTVVYCANCGAEISRSTIAVSATGHSWNSGETTLEATCSAGGVITYTCADCGETKTAATEPLGHKWDKGQITKQATTEEPGEITYTCERCGETKTDTIAKAQKCPICNSAHNKNFIDRLVGLIHSILYFYITFVRTF